MRWELGNVKLHQMIEMKKMPRKEKDWIEKDAQKGKRLNWKRCPERENIEMKKMPRKEKYWNEKDAQMGKDCVEKDEKWFTYY